LKLEEGNVVANTDFGAVFQKIDKTKIYETITILCIAHKAFLYGFI
jgi:hypothetical protein